MAHTTVGEFVPNDLELPEFVLKSGDYPHDPSWLTSDLEVIHVLRQHRATSTGFLTSINLTFSFGLLGGR